MLEIPSILHVQSTQNQFGTRSNVFGCMSTLGDEGCISPLSVGNPRNIQSHSVLYGHDRNASLGLIMHLKCLEARLPQVDR